MASFPAFPVVQQHPVEDAIFGFAERLQHLSEELSKEIVVWCLLETKLTDVVHVYGKLLCREAQVRLFAIAVLSRLAFVLTREALAKFLDRGALLLLADLFVLLLVRSGPKPLPGESTAQKVHEDMTQ